MSGILILGSSGGLQLGNNRPPLVLTDKGTIYTRANAGNIQLATSVADVPTGIVAFRPGGPMALMRSGFMAGTAPVGTPIDYWAFGSIGAGMTFGPGVVKSYDASGALVWSDAMNPMRYAGQCNGDFSTGGLVAAIQARLGNQWRWEPGAKAPNGLPSEDYYGMNGYATAWQASGGGISSTEYNHSRQTTTGTDNPDPAAESTTTCVLLLVDVAGY